MLDSLHIKNFRCFEDLTIESLGRVNLVVGKNSVGKTTLLEAIYIFANGGHSTIVKEILHRRNDFSGEIFHIQSTEKSSFIGEAFDGQGVYIYEDEQGKIRRTRNIKLKKNTISKLPNEHPNSFIHTEVQSESDLAYLWDDAAINSDDEEIKESLKIINKDLTNLIFIDPIKKDHDRIAIVKIKNKSKGIPLKSLGEGMSRLLQIFLHAFQARGGYLIIDEFENGLHYSIQEEVLDKLFKLAKELDIQVFATTHSEDTIKAFCKVTLASEEEGRLIALGRSPASEDNGRIVAVSYDEKEIAVISRTGMEIR
ncbi:MAG: hypothetical protein BWK73_42075 [Thiothrix lacustris]|uniref:ATPase AAA-type core domain-containing protein n=1 Tax=Thiothrix lacustris TaxID=525917 RepID=A0A1Y1QCH3_9GAMM|nr:MAG: hypothetical protein BWK73_42075 [Thiothrix lacustris]